MMMVTMKIKYEDGRKETVKLEDFRLKEGFLVIKKQAYEERWISQRYIQEFTVLA